MKEYEVKNMLSYNGNPVPNQLEIRDNIRKVRIFQSYKTIIAKVYTSCGGMITNKIVLDSNALHYSNTTSKYLYTFLGMSKKEILADKDITYKDLN